MTITARSYLTAGIAALGAGAIALSPVQPIPNHLAAAQGRAVSNLPVSLVAAAIDPFTPLEEMVKTSLANIKTLGEQQVNPGPLLPILSAMGANAGVFLSELPDLSLIFTQVAGNLKAAITAPFDQNLTPLTPGNSLFSYNTNNTAGVTCVGSPTCPGEEYSKFQTTGLLAYNDYFPEFEPLFPIINVLSSPLSGALVGFAGPGLSAFAQTLVSFGNINVALKEKNWAAALNELINLPTNLLNASLNGGKQLDLTPIVEKLAPALGFTLPDGVELGLTTGGLLTPGVAMGGTYGPTEVPFNGWSGTAWDAVSAKADTAIGPAYIGGLPLGLVATQLGMRTTIANAIRLPKPGSVQAVAPAASTAEVEAPAAAEAASVAADVAAAVDAPAPKAVSAPTPAKQSAAPDNDGNGGGRGHHSGARGNNSRG